MTKLLFCLFILLPAAAQVVEVATEVAALEGPTADREGNIYFSNMTAQRIMKLGKDGVLSTYRENMDTNGLVIDPQGRLVACERGKNPRISRIDLQTGKLEVLAANYQGQPFGAPNDVTIDGKGRLYFTDSPAAAVYRIDAPGKITRILAKPDIQRPNGIQISPDDKTLYLVEANRAKGGARMIRAYDLQADGSVRNMRVFHNFYPGRSADGMSLDTQGNLYASAGLNRLRPQPPGEDMTLDTKAGVYVFSPQGKQLKFIPIPEDGITNNGFGGPDMKTLYITAGKTLFKVRTEVPGLPR